MKGISALGIQRREHLNFGLQNGVSPKDFRRMGDSGCKVWEEDRRCGERTGWLKLAEAETQTAKPVMAGLSSKEGK